MIKAGMTKGDGTKIALLGITQDNVDRLQEGKPINVSLEPYGMKGEIIICYGKDTKTLTDQLRPMFGPDTEFGIGQGKGSFVDKKS